MSQNDNDLELDGFDFGDGTDGFVDDEDFGFEGVSESNVDELERHVISEPKRDYPESEQYEHEIQVNQNQRQVVKAPQRVNKNSEKYEHEIQFTGKSDRGRVKSQQRVNANRNVNMSQVTRENKQLSSSKKHDGKKKFNKGILIFIVVLVIGLIFGVSMSNKIKLVPQEEIYEQTGRYAYDNLLIALNNYDANKLDEVVGSDVGDSCLAQEWSYANNIEVRQNFIKSICASVKFNYPQVVQMSTTGQQMMNKDGSPILVTSSMNNGESLTVTYVDYSALSETMKEDKDKIVSLYNESGITSRDYNYEDEMIDLMLSYILSKESLPTKDSEISLGVSSGSSPIVVDDIELDKLLFSSDEFHNMCDVFAQVATGFTGFETEKYTEKEEQSNPEYKQWKMRFDAYYKADKGKFKKGVSKWEPWYLRDDNNNFILDEKGKKIVNYYSIKDDQGNDWIQPSKTILVDVEKERQVEVDWVPDSVIPYCFMGAYYCQNEYKGSFSPEVRVGDGSVEHPAGVGTPIITKCLGTDGKYHDVKVTMTGYWVGEDAIDYAISFSEKNRGFDISSVIQLVCYEIKIENLEDKAFSFKSDMFLADKNSNKSARTGNMYGFYSDGTVEADGHIIINDWATSTELQQKFVCWGSSFKREYKAVYFKLLAGDGDVPTYSAYKAFTGESMINSGEEMPEESAESTTPAQQGTDTTQQQGVDTTQQQGTDTTQQQGADTTQQQGVDTTQQQSIDTTQQQQ